MIGKYIEIHLEEKKIGGRRAYLLTIRNAKADAGQYNDRIFIYGADTWPYVRQARSVYGDRTIYVNVDQEPEKIKEVPAYSGGKMQVLVIVEGEPGSDSRATQLSPLELPHFGSSSSVMLIDYEGGTIRKRDILNTGTDNPMGLARFLVEQGVDELICGVIQLPCREWLSFKGVAVIENQRGLAERLVQSMLKSREYNFKKGDTI